ncbi:MAG: alpha/beta hydrolase [Polyangiaceae bacterium]
MLDLPTLPIRRVEPAGEPAFDVALIEAPSPSRAVLFAAGRGGSPERHAALLEALAARGATVIAPHAEFFANPRPTLEQLAERARRLRRAAEAFAPRGCAIHGVGHSIGATLLLTLAGARAWLGPSAALEIGALPLESVTLLAPPLGFFRAPDAMASVDTRVTLWWGTADALCPRSDVDAVLEALGPKGRFRVAEGAGHFSFMDVPPPDTAEPLADRGRFLRSMSAQIADDLEG